jgi:hypothetical protein
LPAFVEEFSYERGFPLLPSKMSIEPHEPEAVRWRAWPCEQCAGGANVLDFIVGRHEASGALPDGSEDEVIEAMMARERQWLSEWVELCTHTTEHESLLWRLDEGSEHIVYLAPDHEDVLKLTKPGLYGDEYYMQDGRVHQRRATPGNYLLRLELIRRYLGFAPIPLAVTKLGQILSKQKFVKGDPPTQTEVDEFLSNEGLEPVKKSCWLWKKTDADAAIEFWIRDARSDNFVKTPQGLIPIDLRMWGVVVPST